MHRSVSSLRLAWILPALLQSLWPSLLSAADINWRGGTGDHFAETQNWELPDGETEESTRRVPGIGDHAIIPAGATVRVTTTVQIQQAHFAGKLIVEGAEASFSIPNSGEEVTDEFGELDVRQNSRFTAGNEAVFNGPVVVENRGSLSIERSAVLAAGLVLDSGATVTIKPGQILRVGNPSATALLDLRGGTLTAESSPAGSKARVLIETNATLRVGRPDPFTGFLPSPGFSGELVVEDGGRVEFTGPDNSPDQFPSFSGECRLLPGAAMSVRGGYAPAGGGRWSVINFGTITVQPPPEQRPEGFRPEAQVATTLINAGSVVVEEGAVLQVIEGEHLRDARLEVKAGAAFSVVGDGLNNQFEWVDLDGTPQTSPLGKLFNFRASARDGVSFGTDSRLEVVGNGRYGRGFRTGQFFETPGGVLLEHAMEVDHVVLGRFDGQIPQIRFGPGGGDVFPGGVGLRIKKRLDWSGGAFVGNGSAGIGDNPDTSSTANIELPAGAQAFIGRPPEAFGLLGDNYVLDRILTFHVRGGLTINAGRSLVSEDEISRYVFHPGADVEIQAMTSQTGMTIARIFNQTLVRKTGPERVFFNGVWENREEGRLRMDQGDWIIQQGTLVGGNYQVAVTGASFSSDDATLRNFEVTGGEFTLLRRTRLEGQSSFDFLTVGQGLSAEQALQIFGHPAPDEGSVERSSAQSGELAPSVVTVTKGLKWVSNGIEMFDGSKLVLAPGSVNHIESARSVAPAGVFELGTIENHGQTTYVSDANSPFVFPDGTFLNLGSLTLDNRKGSQFFQGTLAGQPGNLRSSNHSVIPLQVSGKRSGDPNFRLLNRGLIVLGLIETGQTDAAIACLFSNFLDGLTRLDEENRTFPQARQSGVGPARLPSADPNSTLTVAFKGEVTLEGGECDFRTVNVQFDRRVTLTGGRLTGGEHGRMLFNTNFTFTGGELRLESRTGPALAKFGRVTTVRNGRLFLDAQATLDALPGFNLNDGSVLSGTGQTTGGVSVENSIVAPGNNGPDHTGGIGALTIGTDIFLPAGAKLLLDVPLAPGAVTDRLIVNNKATLGGTLEIHATAPAAGDLNPDPLVAVQFGSREGEFSILEVSPFRAGLTLSQLLRDSPDNDIILSIISDGGGGSILARSELNDAGKLKLTFETQPGVNYRLERSTDLKAWESVREFVGDGTAQVADNLGGNGDEPEFFRLVTL